MLRFSPWVNKLSELPEPVVDKKVEIKKIEYKLNDRMERTLQSKVLESTLHVTKGYTERKAKANSENFGIGTSEEEIRNNIGLTIVQRDNIWHPYYEVKLEEDDLGAKYRKTIESKREKAAVESQAIEEIQAKLQDLEQAQRDEQLKKDEAANPTEKKKRTFDMKAIAAKKLAEEQEEANKKVEDLYAVKLTNLTAASTEADIRAVFSKFGRIE